LSALPGWAGSKKRKQTFSATNRLACATLHITQDDRRADEAGEAAMNVFGVVPMSLIAICCLTACAAPAPVTSSALVGTYTYHSEDPEPNRRDFKWDRLTLAADGTYRLSQTGKSGIERSGIWKLITIRSNPNVLLDSDGFPVIIRGREVRLMIDYDVAIWLSKVGGERHHD
jgi:hypothetical protein